MEYVRLCGIDSQGKPVNRGTWIPHGSNPYSHIESVDKTYYLSTFIYNDKQFEQFKKTGSCAGMSDVTTDKLYWDFDSKDLTNAKTDAQEMCARLIGHGIAQENILVCFSGAKGFSVEVNITKRLKPDEVKQITSKMAEGLDTYDGSIYDAQRVLRLPETRHQLSGLYKTPLTVDALALPIEEITSLAKEKPKYPPIPIKLKEVELPNSITELRRTDTQDRVLHATILNSEDLDFKFKPKGFSNCKYAIMNGFFPNGSRHDSIMILASTCRANGFPKEVAYNMCKAAARLQAQRTETEPYAKEEIWSQIEGIYGPHWKGGQYTCKSNEILKRICEGLGHNKCKLEHESATIHAEEVFDLFRNYAINFDKNALTTGIGPLDKKVKFLVGSSSGILAPPGVGKSSFAFTMLNHNSEKDIDSIFFSYDMHHSLTYLRLIQKHFGLQQEEIFNLVKEKSPKMEEIKEAIKKEYKNVHFCFKNGQTPDDIERTIVETEDKIGRKVKLVVVDYSELVVADSSDPTQASAQIAQKMRQIANEREVCTVTLYQPSKLHSDPSQEASTYQAAKGSGAIAQSLTLMLGLSRPGFSPRRPEEDNFMTVSVLKNRTGPLCTFDLGWEGLKGQIYELDTDQEAELSQIRQAREAQKAAETFQ